MIKPTSTQAVGQGIEMERGRWNFDGNVADTFSDHVQKSVPLYDIGHDLVCKISDFFVRDGDRCYELGTSTGELIKKLAQYHRDSNITWVGIDSVPAMLTKARENCKGMQNIEFEDVDLVDYEFEKTNFIVAYYTIQFVPPHVRQEVINRLYETLNWGGGLLLFEKVRASDARFQDMATAIYNDFKTDQGFSDDEIMAKSRSLRGTLEPFSTDGNLGLLERAGFKDVMTMMKYVCFEGFLAIK